LFSNGTSLITIFDFPLHATEDSEVWILIGLPSVRQKGQRFLTRRASDPRVWLKKAINTTPRRKCLVRPIFSIQASPESCQYPGRRSWSGSLDGQRRQGFGRIRFGGLVPSQKRNRCEKWPGGFFITVDKFSYHFSLPWKTDPPRARLTSGNGLAGFSFGGHRAYNIPGIAISRRQVLEMELLA
jgi:hypothetical protein